MFRLSNLGVRKLQFIDIGSITNRGALPEAVNHRSELFLGRSNKLVKSYLLTVVGQVEIMSQHLSVL